MDIDTSYTDYYDKNEIYLDNFIQNFLGGRIISKPDESLFEIAQAASTLFAQVKQGNREVILELLHNCYELHIDALYEIKKSDLASRSLMIIKQAEKLDRLFKGENGLAPFLRLGSSSWVSLDHYLVKKGHTETLNAPRFVYNFDQAKPLMIYKQKETEEKYPNIPRHAGVHRQVASYLLDKANGGAANVPLSILSTWNHQVGSLQVYKKNQGPLYSFIVNEKGIDFNRIQEIPARDLQLITVHRSRLYDLDAHLGNILVKRTKDGQPKLIPIDCDYLLPKMRTTHDVNRVSLRLGWSMFPQMNIPMTPEVKDYIMALNTEKDTQILESLDFPSSSIRLMKACTWVWKESASIDLTPGEVIDFLHSNTFKSLFVEQAKTDENLFHDLLKKHLEDRHATTLSNQLLIEKAFQELSQGNTEGLIHFIEELLQKKDPRALIIIFDKLFKEHTFPIVKPILEHFKSHSEYISQIAFAVHIPTGWKEELEALFTSTSWTTTTTSSTPSEKAQSSVNGALAS